MATVQRYFCYSRLIAIAEVCIAFCTMHVAFRSFKRFTAMGHWEHAQGLNFSPGIAMVVVALTAIVLRKQWPHIFAKCDSESDDLGSVGLPPQQILVSIKSAGTCLIVLALLGGPLALIGVQFVKVKTHWPTAMTVAVGNVIASLLLLKLLDHERDQSATKTQFLVRSMGIVVLMSIPAAIVCLAMIRGTPTLGALMLVIALGLGAALAEEMFFRGYIQSRLNCSFGKPWCIFGTTFGPGLIMAAALFGAVHVLNPFDYFGGNYQFAWPHALTTCSSLYYGLLRERTGDIVAPTLVHLYTNLGAGLLAQL